MRRLLAGFGALVFLAGCGGGSDTAAPTTTAAPPTTPRPRVSTTFTTLAPRTTTTLRATREQQIATQVTAFAKVRERLIEAIPKDVFSIESVDRLEFDPAGPTIRLDATSGYSTDEYVENDAWELTRVMAELWTPKIIAPVPDAVPNLEMTVSDHGYSCSADFMLKLGDHRASRADWETAC